MSRHGSNLESYDIPRTYIPAYLNSGGHVPGDKCWEILNSDGEYLFSIDNATEEQLELLGLKGEYCDDATAYQSGWENANA